MDPITMPFGKHKGKLLSEIPEDYLQWLVNNVDMNPWLDDAVTDELARRAKERRHGQSSFFDDDDDNYGQGPYRTHGSGKSSNGYSYSRQNYSGGSSNGSSNGYGAGAGRVPSTVDRDTAIQIVEAGRRALARKHHPDAGGSTDMMQKINAITDWLEEHLKGILPAGASKR